MSIYSYDRSNTERLAFIAASHAAEGCSQRQLKRNLECKLTEAKLVLAKNKAVVVAANIPRAVNDMYAVLEFKTPSMSRYSHLIVWQDDSSSELLARIRSSTLC